MDPESSPKLKRPFGVYILLFALVLLAASGAADLWRVLNGLPPHTLPELGLVSTLIVYGIQLAFYVVLSVGLWRMWTWAWFLAMVAGGLSLLFCIVRYIDGGTPYVTMILVMVMVFYLNLAEVKAAFRTRTEAEATS